MDFARKQLEKYGWTAGKGLGKNENGISEALKPKLKRSVSGVGHDLAADFTEHWWNNLYNKAAKNVEVEEVNGKVKKIKCKDATFEITNNAWQIKKKGKGESSEEQYTDYFVKTAILSSGGSKVENLKQSESEHDGPAKDIVQITDEELFAACGGRTAHKGARHGLKALGKLARIEQQEKILLNQEKYSGYSHKTKHNTEMEFDKVDLKEKNNKLCDNEQSISKKKKKKKCHSENNVTPEIIKNPFNSVEEDLKIKTSDHGKKKGKRKIGTDFSIESHISEEVIIPKKVKKNTFVVENTVSENNDGNCLGVQNDANDFLIKKHKKKRKKIE